MAETKRERETRLKRLHMLEEMLMGHKEIFPAVKFDIRRWGARTCCENSAQTACKTAACALGSAAMYPPFRKRGLSAKWPGKFMMVLYHGKYGAHYGYMAGAVFFGITRDESYFLFDPSDYRQTRVTARSVAARVRKLIKKYEAAERADARHHRG